MRNPLKARGIIFTVNEEGEKLFLLGKTWCNFHEKEKYTFLGGEYSKDDFEARNLTKGELSEKMRITLFREISEESCGILGEEDFEMCFMGTVSKTTFVFSLEVKWNLLKEKLLHFGEKREKLKEELFLIDETTHPNLEMRSLHLLSRGQILELDKEKKELTLSAVKTRNFLN